MSLQPDPSAATMIAVLARVADARAGSGRITGRKQ
jgi:hypothetical protein